MGFLGVYRALYDYASQSEGELAIAEGNLLYLLDKEGDDGWWKAKKKAVGEDEEEPEGLIPNNYVEEAEPAGFARAQYEYTRQTDEELSFPEDAKLAIYDTSDPDWILAGYKGEFGFVPANYIDVNDAGDDGQPEASDSRPPPALPTRQAAAETNTSSPRLPPRGPTGEPSSPVGSPAATALANVLAGRSASQSSASPALPNRPRYMSDASEEEYPRSPPLPSRPRPTYDEEEPSPPLPQRSNSTAYNNGSGSGSSNRRGGRGNYDDEEPQSPRNMLSPGGFHLYNISEMVSVMGKRKKMPTTLGINLKTGMILIAPEKSQDGPSQEWSADKMTHYSREGKHVFMELVRPSKSVDFHAGAKDTAEEIVGALGEMAGAVRAEGLREVILAGSGKDLKKAIVLYDFVAQGDDEVTVAIGDEVIILDDSRSEEWCQVRRVKNGKEGVVPSSYVEVTGKLTSGLPTSPTALEADGPAISAASAIAGSKTTVKQNRLDEERLTRDAVRAAVKDESRRASEVGPGQQQQQQRRSKHENGRAEASGSSSRSSKSKPDASKVRTWTDRTKSFSVEAQFLGLKDSKINLHKMNGVKIAVPVAKMSVEDLEYVESVTGVSLDEDKPLSHVRKRSMHQNQLQQEAMNSSGTKMGASVEPKKPEYDWFQFFLTCDVAPGLCERYGQAFVKDSMDESVLPDIDAGVLRTLGLREGDIIKVMRFLDNKFGRNKKKSGDEDASEGGLFSGPGGTLRNNTRRGRPTPSTQTSNVVDAKAFSQQSSGEDSNTNGNDVHSPTTAAPPAAAAPSTSRQTSGGFDDDAWDVKPSKQQPAAATTAAPAAAPVAAVTPAAPEPVVAPVVPKPTPQLTGSLQELSLLSQPLPAERLNPVPTGVPTMTMPPPQQPPVLAAPPVQQPQQQLTGASPAVFANIAQQQTGINGAQQQASYARARPMAPQYTQGQGGLLPPPPPPTRPLSAPQSAQTSAFGPPPLQPQMTGYLTGQVTGQVAPPGQSLNDINQQRMMQQQQQQQQQFAQQMQANSMMPQPTGMMPTMTGMPMQQQPQQTGFGMPGQFGQPGMMNGLSQFTGMQMQPTGFGAPFNQGQQFGTTAPGGINSILPPALDPQRTAMPGQMQTQALQPQALQTQALQPQPTGPFTQGFGNHGMAPAPPPVPPQPAALVAQKTGPAPPVRFGVSDDKKKLMPQATGRRANLSAATPENPFGF